MSIAHSVENPRYANEGPEGERHRHEQQQQPPSDMYHGANIRLENKTGPVARARMKN